MTVYICGKCKERLVANTLMPPSGALLIRVLPCVKCCAPREKVVETVVEIETPLTKAIKELIQAEIQLAQDKIDNAAAIEAWGDDL